jgi:hypothetical protein
MTTLFTDDALVDPEVPEVVPASLLAGEPLDKLDQIHNSCFLKQDLKW